MEINKRDRTELKSYFVKNAIPTESNFAELIEAMLNQKDDGIVKMPGDPLSVQAGTDESKKVINFYQNFTDTNPSWVLSLNPGGKPGFNISDGALNSRLFIDQNTGNVGIGTPTPSAKLEVNGDLTVTGVQNFGRQTRQMINLWDTNYGIGVQISTQYYRTDKNFAWYKGGSHHHSELNAGGGTVQMVIKDGNVGIGTPNPSAKLEVNGFTQSLGVSVNNGQNTGVGRGLWLWHPTDSNHVIYSAHPNGKSPANKNPAQGFFDAGHRLRLRTHRSQGFLFENDAETALIDIDATDGRLWTLGAMYCGNSDIYFTKTDHNHSTIGNTSGYAAIENAANYDALMILGRAGTQKGRYVRLWDYFQVNGSMDITGNLGIGTSNPSHKFHVRAGDAVGLFESVGTQAYLRFVTKEGMSNRVEIANRPGGRLALWVGGAGDVFNILKSGNVGLGTANPGVRLEVNGDIKTNVALISDNPHGVNYAAFSHKDQGTSGGYALLQHKDGETYLNTPDGKNINIRVNNATKMRIISNGNVGIGTDGPTQKLDVRGNIYYSGILTKLDVADNFTAIVRAGDFLLGHPTRRGSPGRALVDYKETLRINYGGDWPNGVRFYVSMTKASSRKLKENIIDLPKQDAFKLLEALNPVKFTLKADELKRMHLGFIAEDTPVPIVTDDGEAIDNDHIVAVLTQVVKEQQKAVAALSAQVNRLEAQRVP